MFSEYILPILLPSESDTSIEAGQKCTVSGWGKDLRHVFRKHYMRSIKTNLYGMVNACDKFQKSDLDDSIFFLEKLQSQEKFISTSESCSKTYKSAISDIGNTNRTFCADDQDQSQGKVDSKPKIS